MSETTDKIDNSSNLRDLTRRAGEIAQNAHLLAINMRRLDVSLLCEPSETQRPASLTSEHRISHDFKPAEGPDTFNNLRVKVDFDVRVSDDVTSDNLFRMKVTFEADYRLNRGMPDSAIETIPAFAATNAVVHVWPYYRELVQSTTWRMGLPPFPLPLFRVMDQSPGKRPAEERRPQSENTPTPSKSRKKHLKDSSS